TCALPIWAGVVGAQVLALGVCPPVFFGAGHINRPRGHQGNQLMLVNGPLLLLAAILIEGGAEPWRLDTAYPLDALPVFAARKGGTTFARIIGNDHLESRVLRTCPKGCFTLPGVSHDGDSAGVDLWFGKQVIHNPARAPCPRTDGLPLIRRFVA